MNSSILSILLTSVSIFVLNFAFYFTTVKYSKLSLQVSLILTTTLVIYLVLNGRAAVIGACANIVYVFFNHRKLFLPKKFILNAVVVFTAVLVVIAFSLKKDSSSGRILIYKVVFTQLKLVDYFSGLGIGKFKARYNQLQADYFEQGTQDAKEVLLAGNGYYLFNDWLQFALEIGVIGVLLICCFLILFFKIFTWQPHNNPILFAANGGLITISTAALFSYPLQVIATLFFFIFCAVIHIYSSYSIKAIHRHKYLPGILHAMVLSVTLLSIYYCSVVYQYKLKSKLAFELYRDGFKDEADAVFNELSFYKFSDYNTHYNYAYMLYFKNELNNALQEINKALDLAYSADGVKLKADILWELNNATEAEFFYKQTVYITPHRMLPKFNLLQFYIKTKELDKAKYWASDILKMPIKKPSPATDKMLNESIRNQLQIRI